MRSILITGGTGKVGKEIIRGAVESDFKVYFTTRDLNKGEALLKELDYPENCVPIEVEFSENLSYEKAIFENISEVDSVIHNVRNVDNLEITNGRSTSENFQHEYWMAVTMPYLLTMALLDKGRSLKDVIFISSMYGSVAANPNLYTNFHNQSPIVYGPSKAAQIHLAKELAVRLGEQGIRVNTVSYGGIEGRVDEDFKRRYNKLSPSGKMLSDRDIYPPIAFLMDHPSLNITGENIKIDGGWTIW